MNIGVINYRYASKIYYSKFTFDCRKTNKNFGVAVCTLDFVCGSVCVRSIDVEADEEAPNVAPPCRFATRRASWESGAYLLDDPPFASRIYTLGAKKRHSNNKLEDFVCVQRNIELRYDVRKRISSVVVNSEQKVGELICLNDGIDKTCAELSVYLANLRTGLVQNYKTRLAADKFPLKCDDRLVESVSYCYCKEISIILNKNDILDANCIILPRRRHHCNA